MEALRWFVLSAVNTTTWRGIKANSGTQPWRQIHITGKLLKHASVWAVPFGRGRYCPFRFSRDCDKSYRWQGSGHCWVTLTASGKSYSQTVRRQQCWTSGLEKLPPRCSLLLVFLQSQIFSISYKFTHTPCSLWGFWTGRHRSEISSCD